LDRFGRELRRLRERAGFTQAQLAARLGYDHTYLSKLESGARVPPITFARQADDLLKARGALLALATNARMRRPGRDADSAGGPAGMPLPCPPHASHPVKLPPVRPISLPAFGITCPLHGAGGCTLSAPVAGLADLLGDKARTAGAETVHGFAALLTRYIEADLEALTGDLAMPVEQALHALLDTVPQARGAVATGLLHLAAQYADLAGWLRIKRGQHGIGMTWLHRSLEWAAASRNFPTACEALSSMSVFALMEGDAATALRYGRAAAGVDPHRRWTTVQADLDQARAHAVLGDWAEFTRHADEAQRVAERLGDRDRVEAPWLSGAEGETFVASHLAGALRDLADTTGDPATAGRAVLFARKSLANVPSRMHASRLMLTLRLADSHACSGDIDAAVAVARPVIQTAESAQVTLISHELDRLRTRLGDRSTDLFDG